MLTSEAKSTLDAAMAQARYLRDRRGANIVEITALGPAPETTGA